MGLLYTSTTSERPLPWLCPLSQITMRRLQIPPNPKECVFALTIQTFSADLKTKTVPCQFGGNPDCGSCGCIASMGLAAVTAHKLGGVISIGAIFKASIKIGQARDRRSPRVPAVEEALRVLSR